MRRRLSVIVAVGVCLGLFPSFAALPDGYDEFDYVSFPIETTFDTGISPENVQISMVARTSYVSDRHFFGQKTNGRLIHLTEYNNRYYWGSVGVSEGNSGSILCPTNAGVHSFEIVYNAGGTGDIVVNGETVGTGVASNTCGGEHLLIGSRSNNANFVGDVCSFAVTNANNEGLLDLVPCRRQSDGRVGFYDRVGGRFLAPSDGSRLLAPITDQLECLDYVHFLPGCYLDTGLSVSNVQVTMEWSQDVYTENAHMFGTGKGGTSIHFTSYANKWYWGNNGTAESNGGSWTPGRHRVVYGKTGTANGDVELDGAVIGAGTLQNSTSGSSSHLVVGSRVWGVFYSDGAIFEGDVYAFQVETREGRLICDLLPARRRADGVVGFYDRVRGVFLQMRNRPACAPDELGYEFIDHVEMRSGQWVDTGFKVTSPVEITMSFETDYVSDRHMFGQDTGGNYIHFTEFNDKWYWGINGSEANSGSVGWSGGRHTVVYNRGWDGSLVLDGIVIGTGVGGGTTGNKNLLLGRRSSKANFAGSVYSFAVTNQNGTALLDYAPCRRLPDGAVGFYDRVARRFVAVSGAEMPTTVDMTDAYEPVEAIDFDVMTAYLDTGIAFANCQVSLKFESDYLKDRHVIGQEEWSRYLHFTMYNDLWFWGVNGAEANSGTLEMPIAWSAGVHEVVINQIGTGKVFLDGAEIGSAINATTHENNLLIGVRNGATNFLGKVYSLAVTNQSGQGLLDLRPCVCKADGRYGFFNRVDGRFITSPPLGRRPGRDPGRPQAGFTQLEYVGVNGAYVDTLYCPSDRTRIVAKYRTFDRSVDKMLFGVRNFDYTCVYWLGSMGGQAARPQIGKSDGTRTASGQPDGMRHVIDASYSRATIDGEVIYENGTATGATTSRRSLLLFGLSGNIKGGIDRRCFVGDCYGFKIYDAGELVRDLVPARRDKDGWIGMYDLVTGIFFEPQGSTFLPGPESHDGVVFIVR